MVIFVLEFGFFPVRIYAMERVVSVSDVKQIFGTDVVPVARACWSLVLGLESAF